MENLTCIKSGFFRIFNFGTDDIIKGECAFAKSNESAIKWEEGKDCREMKLRDAEQARNTFHDDVSPSENPAGT